MKKALKIVAWIVGGLLVFLLLAIILIPVVFKKQIKEKVIVEVNRNVYAQVYFDDLGISLIKHFPYATVSLKKLKIIGKDEFQKDTLAAIESFDIAVNLKSLLTGDKIKIRSIVLVDPSISIKVLENGKANYNISIPDTTKQVSTDTAKSTFALAIDKWKIKNGRIRYDDKKSKLFTEIIELNHSGKGDFTQDVFDLQTNTTMASFTLAYGGVNYFSKNKVAIDMGITINMLTSTYTFKDNKFQINDFAFGFNGFLAMQKDAYAMDITFAAKENTFKSILSLIPVVYVKDFEKIKTDGKLAFNGSVKGIYHGDQLPAFNLNLSINDGMFQYPNLPTSVNNITTQVAIKNPGGSINNTVIAIDKLHLDMGKNPIDAVMIIKGISSYDIDGTIKAKVDLADLAKMFPMDMQLKGLYQLDLKLKGVYKDSTQIPTLLANMSLENGYVQSESFPIPLEQINLHSMISNQTGKPVDTKIVISQLTMLLEKEKMEIKASVENLSNYTWDVMIKGVFDLEKLTKVYSVDGMNLAGKIKVDLTTKGKMSDVEKKRYDKIYTSGSLAINSFKYEGKSLPQGFGINIASIQFNPDHIQIKTFEGYLGKSDLNLSGNLSNYMGYLFKENESIKGKMVFYSKKFDTNEWMSKSSSSSTPPPTAEDTTHSSMSVVQIPKNIDFTLQSSIDEVLYDNLVLKDLKGEIVIKDGVLKMNQLDFNTLGGRIALTGNYDPRNVQQPLYNLDLDIQKINIKNAYNAFNTVKLLVPIADKIDGDFSTKFKLAGELKTNMMPNYATLKGGGAISIAQATLKELSLGNQLSAITKVNNLSNDLALKDLLVQTEIKDGRVHFKPFDIAKGDQKINISGSNGIDGTIDYLIKMDMPGGAVGNAVNSVVSSFTGKQVDDNSTLRMNLNVTGSNQNPKVSLANVEQVRSNSPTTTNDKSSTPVTNKTEEVKEEIKNTQQETQQKVEEKAKDEIEKAKEELKKKLPF